MQVLHRFGYMIVILAPFWKTNRPACVHCCAFSQQLMVTYQLHCIVWITE